MGFQIYHPSFQSSIIPIFLHFDMGSDHGEMNFFLTKVVPPSWQIQAANPCFFISGDYRYL